MDNLPKVKSSRTLHDGFFSLREDLLERPDGKVHPYTVLIANADAVAILAQTPSGLWILNREYRHATGKVLIGCPGGLLETGESPLIGGKREFSEETGYWLEEISLIGCCHPYPGLSNQKIHYLLGKNAVKKGQQNLDPLECIEPILIHPDDLRQQIRKGIDVDGILLTALWLKEHF